MNARDAVRACLAGLLSVGAPVPIVAQDTAAVPGATPGFFDRETPLEVVLTANYSALRHDRSDDPAWRPARLRYTDADGRAGELPLRVRPRGVWRRRHCQMPPLRLDFVRSQLAATPFAGLNRPKLVNYCQNSDRAEQYILQEAQLYRVYHRLAPLSHRVRLLRIAYEDSASGKVLATRYGFLIEEPETLGARVGGRMMELNGIEPAWLDVRSRTLVGVFQHFIGNHDWSITALHNVEVIGRDSLLHPVPYDFDYSGAVNAHYAVPPPQVPVRRVRERYFRGHCAPDTVLAEVLELFRANREAIRALYRDDVGRLMKPAVAAQTLAYFDDFYETIDDPEQVQRTISRRCRTP